MRILFAATCTKATAAFGCVLPVLYDTYEDMFTVGARYCCNCLVEKPQSPGDQPFSLL